MIINAALVPAKSCLFVHHTDDADATTGFWVIGLWMDERSPDLFINFNESTRKLSHLVMFASQETCTGVHTINSMLKLKQVQDRAATSEYIEHKQRHYY